MRAMPDRFNNHVIVYYIKWVPVSPYNMNILMLMYQPSSSSSSAPSPSVGLTACSTRVIESLISISDSLTPSFLSHSSPSPGSTSNSRCRAWYTMLHIYLLLYKQPYIIQTILFNIITGYS